MVRLLLSPTSSAIDLGQELKNLFIYWMLDMWGVVICRWIDTLKSTLHRVRAPPLKDGEDENGKTKERFSIPYVRIFSSLLSLLHLTSPFPPAALILFATAAMLAVHDRRPRKDDRLSAHVLERHRQAEEVRADQCGRIYRYAVECDLLGGVGGGELEEMGLGE